MRRLAPLALALACLGCSSTRQVDTHNDAEITVSFDWRDFDLAAADMAQSLLASPRLADATEEKPLVLAVGRLTNDTCQHLDMDLVAAKLGEALLASGRFDLSAVFADRESNRDASVSEARTVRGNAEFDQRTVQAVGQLKAPDLSLSGKITQRNVRRDNGGLRVEYLLTLTVTRLATGSSVWQHSANTVKSVADGMPVW